MNPIVQDLLESGHPVTREMYELVATWGDDKLLPGLEETMPQYVRDNVLADVPVSDPDYYDIVEILEDFPHLTVESVRNSFKYLV